MSPNDDLAAVCKFNANTEVREAIDCLARCMASDKKPDLLDIMTRGIRSMQYGVSAKLQEFCLAEDPSWRSQTS